VQLFNDEISDFARRRLDLLTALPPAIEAGELELLPATANGQHRRGAGGCGDTVALEQFAFWASAHREVIQIAEHAGLMDLLSRYIVTQAWRTMQTLQERQLTITCSINLSVQNLTDTHFVSFALAGIRGTQHSNESRDL